MISNGISGLIAVILWLGTFLPGLTVSSKPFRDQIAKGMVSFDNMTMAFLTYTVTNVGILCCMAGVIGASARNFLTTNNQEGEGMPRENNHAANAIFSGLLRGFLIYLLFLAGIYAATESPFANPTPEQYARMAGTVSVISFIISYEPNFFQVAIGVASSRVRKTGV